MTQKILKEMTDDDVVIAFKMIDSKKLETIGYK